MSLSSSSFFLSSYLTEQLSSNHYRIGQITYALKHNHITALTIEERKTELGSTHWLTLNRELAKNKKIAALKLGNWYQQAAKQKSNTKSISKAIMWFEQAIRLGSKQAIFNLTQLYYRQGKTVTAEMTLRALPDVLPDNELAVAVLLLRITMAIELGDVTRVKSLLKSDLLKLYGNAQTKRLLTDIDRYSVIDDSSVLTSTTKNKIDLNIENSKNCITSLQLFATSLSHLKHLEMLIKGFKEQQKLAEYICLPTPRYISIKNLDCEAQAQHAISCDELRWESVAKEVNTRHIGLMLKDGGANVHLGILYFDVNDNTDVFSHEVSHLLGFVDEYPLIKGHAKCQGIQQKPFAHNMAVLNRYYHGEQQELRASILINIPWAHSINASTPILEEIRTGSSKKQHWRLGTPKGYANQIGVHISESCQKSASIESLLDNSIANFASSNIESAYASFKPLSRHTQLRYFNDDFPEEYLGLLNTKPYDFLMPSFHYNIALALYKQGQLASVKYWVEQAAKWEDDPVRKVYILEGAF
ncbi:hypothetical protein [Colwellia sp. Bg11-28]|uniref:hypothetical protein n=1 Tax=Colwellia sp. Bg11-28 TaxID=2058305 RepID=UPI000C31DAC8|nr:hypothetical protein [Colwellia sp. Bg11-28]PKH87882.1 hypothetical protein CXF79_14775 [Colwellia sp. Bg11-28]